MTEAGIGIQLHTVREPLKQDFSGTVKRVAEMGFKGVELAFYYGGLQPADLKRFLDQLNLHVIGIYENVQNICDPEADVYRYADALDCRYITFGVGRAKLEQDLPGALEVSREATKTAVSRNKTLCYHAHAHEFETYTDGKSYLEHILNGEGLTELGFAADTGWIHQGGEDVVGYMERYVNRIPFLHLKDMTADGEVTELGNGVIDLQAVMTFAAQRGIPWLSYEQEKSRREPLESTAISMDYLKRITTV